MKIRQETKKDQDEIYDLIKTAFETAKVADGDEQDFAAILRQSERYIPELALVAEQDGKLIGHAMLTKTTITDGDTVCETLMLGPISVLIDHRCKGIGGALMKEAFSRAAALGYTSVFLAGDPAYYSRFGFKPVKLFGISCSENIPEHHRDCVMGIELVPGALNEIAGVVAVQ